MAEEVTARLKSDVVFSVARCEDRTTRIFAAAGAFSSGLGLLMVAINYIIAKFASPRQENHHCSKCGKSGIGDRLTLVKYLFKSVQVLLFVFFLMRFSAFYQRFQKHVCAL